MEATGKNPNHQTGQTEGKAATGRGWGGQGAACTAARQLHADAKEKGPSDQGPSQGRPGEVQAEP